MPSQNNKIRSICWALSQAIVCLFSFVHKKALSTYQEGVKGKKQQLTVLGMKFKVKGK